MEAAKGFAALLSSHYAPPRGEMFDALSGLGRVDGTGAAFHTMDWPAELPNNYLHGKVPFLRRYRFSVCPENSRSSDGGYTSEKMPQALVAGAVPVYWGDAPAAEVWSEGRVLRWSEGDGGAAALEIVRQLESNLTFQREWFARPELVAGADAWVASWLARLESLLREAFGKVQRARAEHEIDKKAVGLAR